MKGFTLPEVLIGMTVATGVVILTLSVYEFYNRFSTQFWSQWNESFAKTIQLEKFLKVAGEAKYYHQSADDTTSVLLLNGFHQKLFRIVLDSSNDYQITFIDIFGNKKRVGQLIDEEIIGISSIILIQDDVKPSRITIPFIIPLKKY